MLQKIGKRAVRLMYRLRPPETVTEPTYNLMEGYMPLPKIAVIEPTMRCNLSCWFCYQNEVRTRLIRDLKPEQWEQVIDNLMPEITDVRFIGGEVFAYKHIFDLFEMLAKRKVRFGFTTNATLIPPDKVERLISLKPWFVSMGVSIDGTEAAHDAIRGAGNYRKSLAAMRALSPHVRVSSNMVIVPENMHTAKTVLRELANETQLHHMSFQFVQYATQSELDHTREMFGVPAVHIDATVVPEGTQRTESVEKMLEFMDDIRAEARALGVMTHFEPRIAETDFRAYWEGTLERDKVPLACTGLHMPRINYRGELNFCTYIRPILGNLLENHIRDLWNGDAMRHYRKVLVNHQQMVPVCQRCCRAKRLEKPA